MYLPSKVEHQLYVPLLPGNLYVFYFHQVLPSFLLLHCFPFHGVVFTGTLAPFHTLRKAIEMENWQCEACKASHGRSKNYKRSWSPAGATSARLLHLAVNLLSSGRCDGSCDTPFLHRWWQIECQLRSTTVLMVGLEPRSNSATSFFLSIELVASIRGPIGQNTRYVHLEEEEIGSHLTLSLRTWGRGEGDCGGGGRRDCGVIVIVDRAFDQSKVGGKGLIKEPWAVKLGTELTFTSPDVSPSSAVAPPVSVVSA